AHDDDRQAGLVSSFQQEVEAFVVAKGADKQKKPFTQLLLPVRQPRRGGGRVGRSIQAVRNDLDLVLEASQHFAAGGVIG
nr:hypothetical protein [Tanacetum cinerariifolium]